MRNKSDLDTMSMDDLYNNLKVYKDEIKSLWLLYLQKTLAVLMKQLILLMKFLLLVHRDKLLPQLMLMMSCFPSSSTYASSQGQASSSTEAVNTAYEVTMLTMRVKRFLMKTRRNLNFNGKETVGFDKTKVECYNYHRRGYFDRECRAPRNPGNRNGDVPRRIVLVETPTNALVVQDGIGGYDWSFQAEEGPIDFDLMVHLSSGSSISSSSDSE
ncbi:hypothetical protein Tco_0164886, partial [Tanacetum coccineum]